MVVTRREALSLAFASMLWTATSSAREPIVGLPCEGCDAVFVGLPTSIGSPARIAPADEPGQPLHLRGRVLDASGNPVAGVIVYAYHTNNAGIYPTDAALKGTAAARHGRLRGWARSNERGEYEFDTIRPGPYPGRTDPQHIHMHVIEPGRCTYYIGNVQFTDDPRLTPKERANAELRRGGPGVATPVRDGSGVWQVTRDIRLGANIPGYGSCTARAAGRATQAPLSHDEQRVKLRAAARYRSA